MSFSLMSLFNFFSDVRELPFSLVSSVKSWSESTNSWRKSSFSDLYRNVLLPGSLEESICIGTTVTPQCLIFCRISNNCKLFSFEGHTVADSWHTLLSSLSPPLLDKVFKFNYNHLSLTRFHQLHKSAWNNLSPSIHISNK